MGFKIKNSLTGEFEKLPILTLKGEKGETGGVEEYNKVDYMGNKYETLKQANDANVEYAVKTAIGEFNYLNYDGQHITATDSIEGRSKSAILKGQTLINLSPFTKNNGVYELNASTHTTSHVLPVRLQQNKRYIFIFKLTNSQSSENSNFIMCRGLLTDGAFREFGRKIQTFSNGKHWFMLSSSEGDIDSIFVGTNFDVTLSDTLIIEYQDGMENWNIPYFEGMQSVKMPVLTTVGKNLFSNEFKLHGNNVNKLTKYENGFKVTGYIDSTYSPYQIYQVKSNTQYTFSLSIPSGNGYLRISDYYSNKDHGLFFGGNNNEKSYKTTFTTVSDKIKIEMFGHKASIGNTVELINIQLEENSKPTTYEPYKSNILSTSEDVELRGIGDVRDTLDLMTGEVVHNIGVSKITGAYSVFAQQELINTCLFTIKPPVDMTLSSDNYIISNRFPTFSPDAGGLWNTDIEGISRFARDGLIRLRINKSKASTLSELVEWLKENEVVIMYQLSEKSIKTVDLSDNHVYSYKGTTHYDCSSAEGSLVPTLSVKVPTDVQATIAQQRETIQTLNSENERLNQIQEALKASMLDSQVQLMNLSWDTDFEVFTLRESIAPKDFSMDSRTGSNIDKFSQAKFIIENDCPDLEKLNSQIEYYFSKDVFSQEQFEELTDLISIVKGENGCEY